MKSNLKLWQVLICTVIACGILYFFIGPHRFKTNTEPTKSTSIPMYKTERNPSIQEWPETIVYIFTKIPNIMDMDVIVDIESSGNPDTPDSPAGARGLCQIMPKTWAECTKRMGVDWSFEVDAFDPVKNLKVGTWYINTRIPQMIKYYKLDDDYKNRIIAYSWGIGNLRKYKAGKVTELRKETSDYIKKYTTRYIKKVHAPDGENS